MKRYSLNRKKGETFWGFIRRADTLINTISDLTKDKVIIGEAEIKDNKVFSIPIGYFPKGENNETQS